MGIFVKITKDNKKYMNEMYPVYKEMLDPMITYYLPVCYLLRIQQFPVNTTYDNDPGRIFFLSKSFQARRLTI